MANGVWAKHWTRCPFLQRPSRKLSHALFFQRPPRLPNLPEICVQCLFIARDVRARETDPGLRPSPREKFCLFVLNWWLWLENWWATSWTS
ncbi:hypothetical protein NPIL_187111 [Nephila pilipes]|uniref:Uncharacterized protein n=1 Tax=Nephila pilipes TaxID=299642 RepID=A0A8X6TU84_NEPPI|nr:hypothetical protein NPIL_187111 [Nephila pilipes]